MKICIIAKYLEGIHNISGGLERHISDLTSGISKYHTISIITSKHPEGKKELEINGIKIYFVNQIISRNPVSRIKFFKAVANKLNELDYNKKFDLLHIESDFGIGIFNYLEKKIPTVTTVHGCLKNDFFASIKAKKYLMPVWALVYPLYKAYEKKMLYKSDKIVCVSKTLSEVLKNEYPEIKNKFVVINNGVNPKYYYKDYKLRAKMRIQYNLKKDFVLLFVGSLIMKKGLQNIIEILPEIIKKNKNLRLFVVGSGNYRSNLELLVKKNNLEKNVVFIGKINSKKMVNYYNLADLLVMPSLFIETFPYTILEAMSCGLPVFASNIGGIPEIIDNNTGFLVDVNNKKQLINDLSNAINSNNYKIKTHCLNKIKKQYFITNMIKKYAAIYKKVQL